MKKHVFGFRSLVVVLLLFAGIQFAVAGGRRATGSSSSSGEKIVTIATTYTWMALCPMTWFTKDAQAVFSYPAFEPIAYFNSKGEMEPRLLESWVQSTDGRVLTCKVRENAFFHDGTPITAEDIVWSMELAANPEFDNEKTCKVIAGTDNGGNWARVEDFGVKAQGTDTVIITMKTPMAPLTFFYSLRGPVVMPKALLKDKDVKTLKSDPFWEHPIGSGPFKFDNMVTGERMEFVAFDKYYLGRPKFDRLIVRTIPASNTLSALMTGEVDMLAYASSLAYADYEMAKNDPNLVALQQPGFSHDHVIINNEKHNKFIRQAIESAINKQALVDACLRGYGTAANTPYAPMHLYHKNEPGNTYNPDRARALLRQAGWNPNYEMLCYVQSDQAIRIQAAQMIQQMLAEVGVKVKIQQADMGTISAALFRGDHDIAVMGSAATPFEPDADQFYYQPIPDGWNRMANGNPFITLMQKGVSLTSFEQRKPIYDQFQDMLPEEVPMIFLFNKDNLMVHTKRVKNAPFADFPIKDWKYHEWEIE
jgi:peptide/nickel transport system substrate-binding protein